ncbi:DUF3040 domain-containing protein [Kitasatospora sp. NBC_00315]|uniref:DUF3040 domain-containing protein n=1 Tax=Kitasatospora sp. NBC_00315 TaxID=2975963 RepID=UPI0032534D0E
MMSAQERQVLAEIECELGRDRRLVRRLARGRTPWWWRARAAAVAAAVLGSVGVAAAAADVTARQPVLWWVCAAACVGAVACAGAAAHWNTPAGYDPGYQDGLTVHGDDAPGTDHPTPTPAPAPIRVRGGGSWPRWRRNR